MSNIIISIVYFYLSVRAFYCDIFQLQKPGVTGLSFDRIVCFIRRKYDALRHRFLEFSSCIENAAEYVPKTSHRRAAWIILVVK